MSSFTNSFTAYTLIVPESSADTMTDTPFSTPGQSNLPASRSNLLHSEAFLRASQRVKESTNPRALRFAEDREVRERLASIENRSTLEYSEPPLMPVPPVRTLDTASDPEQPVQLQSQLEMIQAFEYDGRFGLYREIYRQAKMQRDSEASGRGASLRNDSSWQKLLDDQTSGRNLVYHLLMTLPDEVIVSLIKNTIVHDSLRKPAVRFFFRNRSAWKGPGISANVPSLRGNL